MLFFPDPILNSRTGESAPPPGNPDGESRRRAQPSNSAKQLSRGERNHRKSLRDQTQREKNLDREGITLSHQRGQRDPPKRERKTGYKHNSMSGLGIKLGSLFIRQISKPISVSLDTTVYPNSGLTNTTRLRTSSRHMRNNTSTSVRSVSL